jgi:POT family proton-dependent oligopeptide transporter
LVEQWRVLFSSFPRIGSNFIFAAVCDHDTMPAEPLEQPEMVGDLKVPAVEEDEKNMSSSPPPLGAHDLTMAETREDYPTAEELETLRRVSEPLPLKIFGIAFVELCERFSYYGTINVLTNYIQQDMPAGSRTGAPLDPGSSNAQPGALGRGQRVAFSITTFNQFFQYTMPLFGAFVADQYWGRFKTIGYALGVDIIGHIILIVSAIPGVIDKPDSSLAALIIGIIVIGFGTGGFKPNISPLIVEQLSITHMRVVTLPKTGERVIIDPAVTINKVYMWFYFFINIGALVGQLTMAYAERYVGFWLSFTLPTIVLALCPAVMAWGRKRYSTPISPAGSVLAPALRTLFLATKGRWSINPWRTWRNFHDGTFWESVKPSKFTDQTRPRWMTFDDQWVDELRRGFNACATFAWLPLYWLTYNQMNNNLLSQAAVMQKHGVPNDVLSNLNPFALLIFIPLCDLFVYPFLRKMRIRFTPIKRIACGFGVASCAMIWACIIQVYIYRTSECGTNAAGKHLVDGALVACEPVSINVWAQTGSYVLIALSEVFTSITSLEYAYSKAPKNMRSMVQAVALFATAFAAALGQAFTGVSEDPLLVWNYGIVAVLAAVGGILFWIQFRGLDREEDALNELPEGRVMHERVGEEESQMKKI